MKHIALLLLTSIIFLSCSKNEDDILQPKQYGVYLKTSDGSEATLNYKLRNHFEGVILEEEEITFEDEKLISFPIYKDTEQGYIEIQMTEGDFSKFNAYYFASNDNMYFKYNGVSENSLAKSILEINKIISVEEGYIDVGFDLNMKYANGEWVNSSTWKPL